MRKLLFIILIIILGSITFFSVYRYAYLYTMHLKLQKDLEKYANRIVELQQEKRTIEKTLTEKKLSLEQELSSTQEKLNQTKLELDEAKNKVGESEGKLFAYQKEIADLGEARKDLEAKLASLEEEKQDLESKFNSIDELKKAIKAIKQKQREARLKTINKTKASDNELSIGNRGFLIWQGTSTLKSKVKIEVIPVNE